VKRVLQLAGLELLRFRTPLQRAALAFAVAVPLLYGAIYLWTNWDPYGRLNQIPVAVVNQDQPVTAMGHNVNAGELFVEQLREQQLFGWRFVDAAAAERGQRDGRYYLVITVPPDFSAKLVSGTTGSPQKAAMQIKLDDANGFIIGKMAETVQSELERQISAAAVSAYFQAAFGGLDTFTSGINTAADGAGKLQQGAGAASSGATQLTDGIGKLHTGSGQLVTGSRQVADGVHQVNLIAGPLISSVSTALPGLAQQAGDISSLAKQVTSGTAAGTQTLAQTAKAVSDDLAAFAAAHPELASDPLFQKAQQAATTAAQNAATVADLAGRIDTKATQVAADVTRLQQNVPGLQNKLSTASADLAKLDSGATQVADGIVVLDKGLADAATGSGQLATGTGQLSSGAGQLADGLRGARDKVPTLDPKQRAELAGTLSSPVQVTLSNAHPADVYGRGLAPFFFGIALWVFGIVAFLLLRPISTRLLAGRTWPATAAFAAWLPVFAVGLVGALLLFIVVDVGLGLRPDNLWGTLGIIVLAVAAFTAIVHVLRLAFGAVGDALALVLLMIQLTSCGGLYPPETLPAPFQVIHPVLPMTYLVDALRVTVSGGQASHLWRAAAVLGGYLVAALVLLVFTAGRQRTWTMARLKPELSV
jgi:putative membrane protein